MPLTLKNHFEKFRANYKKKTLESTNELLYLFDDHRTAAKESANANHTIHKLDLPLVAVLSHSGNHFVVKSNEVEL